MWGERGLEVWYQVTKQSVGCCEGTRGCSVHRVILPVYITSTSQCSHTTYTSCLNQVTEASRCFACCRSGCLMARTASSTRLWAGARSDAASSTRWVWGGVGRVGQHWRAGANAWRSRGVHLPGPVPQPFLPLSLPQLLIPKPMLQFRLSRTDCMGGPELHLLQQVDHA